MNKIEEIFLVVMNAYEGDDDDDDDDDEYDHDDYDDDDCIQFKDFRCFLHLLRTCETAVPAMNFFVNLKSLLVFSTVQINRWHSYQNSLFRKGGLGC